MEEEVFDWKISSLYINVEDILDKIWIETGVVEQLILLWVCNTKEEAIQVIENYKSR